MADEFSSHTVALNSPVGASEIVTPDDATDLTWATRALYVGTSGNVQVTMLSGETVTLQAVQAGVLYPLRVTRVWATGTTAANIIGLR